jgi:hypothetical protein
MLMRREDVRRVPTGLELPDDLSSLKLLDECDYLKYDLGRNHSSNIKRLACALESAKS